MSQKRHTVDRVVAKLRKAYLEVCKALTHSGAANLMWTEVRVWPVIYCLATVMSGNNSTASRSTESSNFV